MKKYFLVFSFIFLTWGLSVQAQVTIKIGGPGAEQLKNLYAGSMVMTDDSYNQNYYYIDPVKKEKYYLNASTAVAKLISAQGTGISETNFKKLPQSKDSKNVDFALVNKLRGKFLLKTQSDNSAWYLNPLDNLLYAVERNDKGFTTLKNLAILIAPENLQVFASPNDSKFKKNSTDAINFNQYFQIKNLLKNEYYQPEKLSDQDLFYGSLSGLAATPKDPYTLFFSPQNKTDFINKLEGSVEGIGAYVDIKNGRFTIISPLDDSPAMRAGLEPNDQVLMVDNIDISGYLLDDAVSLIKGPSGTTVKLKIYRPSQDKTTEISIVREKINLPTIISKKLENNVAYIKINTFSQDLPEKFAAEQKKVIDNNTRGIILDLRNNPGGYTDSATSVADYWLGEGQIVLQEKFKDRIESYTATDGKIFNQATIVLINDGSASASEILALALQKNKAAQIVGQNSFGKGTGQSLINFADGSALKMTIFEWFAPDGTSINSVGIKPDYILTNEGDLDQQLIKAQKLLE